MRQVASFEAVGPYRDKRDQLAGNLEILRKQKTAKKFPQELLPSKERLDQLSSIGLALQSFLADMGITISRDKIPEPRRFHYFASTETMLTAAGPNMSGRRYELASGLCDGYNIYITDSDEHRTIRASGHEAVHFAQYKSWRPEPYETKGFFGLLKNIVYGADQIRTGYVVTPKDENEPAAFDFMQETLVEMTSLYISQRYWPRYPNLPTGNLFEASFFQHLIIGEEMLNKAAAHHGMAPEEIFRPLSAGLFTGSMEGMQLLSSGLGVEGFRAAVHANPVDVPPELAVSIGVPRANDRIDQAIEAGGFEAFGWM